MAPTPPDRGADGTSAPHDALLVLSFGGPEGPDDVMPFLENVTRGRDVPAARLAEVAKHYLHFGGVSPINAQNRALVAAVTSELATCDIDVPVFWGNRNWRPYVGDVVSEMAAAGVRNALVFVTSAYASYSACRQYQDDLATAAEAAGEGAPRLQKLRHYFDHPGFIEPQQDAVRVALAAIEERRRRTTRLIFVAHSVPEAMAAAAGPDGGLYVAQLEAASALVAGAAPDLPWRLAYSSRSGPAAVPWLEPDVNDAIRAAVADGVTDVVVVPIGFVSDHIEVRWDLDVEAAATAAAAGMSFHRTAPPAADPRFVAMVRELVAEQLDPNAPRRALSGFGPAHDICPAGCCRLLSR
ncbi:MAG TPA: ferrochelatase [Mycobacteriales bacterium]|jgi:ferrochelatase|nr:ferrochelatase [Mycobacteriales bacterium]